jgi:ribose transport system substrate-binding protein
MLNGVCKVRKRIGTIAAVIAVCGAVAACGSSSSDSSSTTGATSAAGASSTSSAVTKAKATVAALYKGTDRALPTSGPKAQTGKKVWVISCYEAAVGCSVPAQGFVAASAHLGWKATVVDAKLDPSTATQEIKSAVAAQANAIVVDGFPCSWAPGALASAKAAGVKLYGLLSFDCPGKPLYDGQLLFGKETYEQYLEDQVGAGGPDNFAIGSAALWEGWAAADGLNRVFAGAPQVDAGIGLEAIDKTHPSPSGLGNYNGNKRSQGYEQNYIKIWTGK